MSTQKLNQSSVSQSFPETPSLTDQLNQKVKAPKLSLLDAIRLVESRGSKFQRTIIEKVESTEELSELDELPVPSFHEKTITGDILVNNKFDSIPHVWEPYFPQVGIVGICGASEAGKSTFTRQLALAICNGDSYFLKGKLNLKYKSAIYLSTEDEEISMGVLLKNQTKSRYGFGLKRFRAGLNVANPFTYLDKELTIQRADLVVIDVWSDVFNDNPNDFTKVRANLNEYSKLARKYKTCICLIHHNTKHSEGKDPSKTNLNGSQAIEAKLRTLLELRAINDGQKQLSIVKGNYMSYEDKKKRLILNQGDDLNFDFVRRDEFSAPQCKIKSPKSNNEEVKKRALELYSHKNVSQDKIVEMLKEEFGGDAPSKGTLNKMLNEQNSSQSENNIVID